MRTLNRPMFRYGGPIKEGVMNGIREPKQQWWVYCLDTVIKLECLWVIELVLQKSKEVKAGKKLEVQESKLGGALKIFITL